jgi:predicted transcriptional regulator
MQTNEVNGMPDEKNIRPTAKAKTVAEPKKERAARDKRTEMERLRDQSAILKLSLKGWQQKDIAFELNMSQAMVSRDMRDVRGDLKRSRLNDMNALFARELAKIDLMETEAWAAWDASKGELITSVTTAEEAKGKKAQVKKQQRTGDPRYLETIKWCIAERLRLFGFYAPDKLDLTSKGESLNARDYTDDQLAAIAAGRRNGTA